MSRIIGRSLSLLAVFLVFGFFAPNWVSASSGQYLTCSDFGTKEKAQFEFSEHPYDLYRLDGDGDGQVCEWNPSAGYWAFGFSGVSIIFGHDLARKKLMGPEKVVPLPKGLLYEWHYTDVGTRVAKFEVDTLALGVLLFWIPWLVTVILRNYVLPNNASPFMLVATACVLGTGIVYWFEIWNKS